MNKARGQYRHAQRRAWGRFHLKLTPELMEQFIDKIRYADRLTDGKPNAILVKRESNRVSTWLIAHEGKEYHIVYDSLRKTLVSFLPHNPEEVEEKRRETQEKMRAKQEVKDKERAQRQAAAELAGTGKSFAAAMEFIGIKKKTF